MSYALSRPSPFQRSGLLTVVICNAMRRFNAGELRNLKLIDRAEVHA